MADTSSTPAVLSPSTANALRTKNHRSRLIRSKVPPSRERVTAAIAMVRARQAISITAVANEEDADNTNSSNNLISPDRNLTAVSHPENSRKGFVKQATRKPLSPKESSSQQQPSPLQQQQPQLRSTPGASRTLLQKLSPTSKQTSTVKDRVSPPMAFLFHVLGRGKPPASNPSNNDPALSCKQQENVPSPLLIPPPPPQPQLAPSLGVPPTTSVSSRVTAAMDIANSPDASARARRLANIRARVLARREEKNGNSTATALSELPESHSSNLSEYLNPKAGEGMKKYMGHWNHQLGSHDKSSVPAQYPVLMDDEISKDDEDQNGEGHSSSYSSNFKNYMENLKQQHDSLRSTVLSPSQYPVLMDADVSNDEEEPHIGQSSSFSSDDNLDDDDDDDDDILSVDPDTLANVTRFIDALHQQQRPPVDSPLVTGVSSESGTSLAGSSVFDANVLENLGNLIDKLQQQHHQQQQPEPDSIPETSKDNASGIALTDVANVVVSNESEQCNADPEPAEMPQQLNSDFSATFTDSSLGEVQPETLAHIVAYIDSLAVVPADDVGGDKGNEMEEHDVDPPSKNYGAVELLPQNGMPSSLSSPPTHGTQIHRDHENEENEQRGNFDLRVLSTESKTTISIFDSRMDDFILELPTTTSTDDSPQDNMDAADFDSEIDKSSLSYPQKEPLFVNDIDTSKRPHDEDNIVTAPMNVDIETSDRREPSSQREAMTLEPFERPTQVETSIEPQVLLNTHTVEITPTVPPTSHTTSRLADVAGGIFGNNSETTKSEPEFIITSLDEASISSDVAKRNHIFTNVNGRSGEDTIGNFIDRLNMIGPVFVSEHEAARSINPLKIETDVDCASRIRTFISTPCSENDRSVSVGNASLHRFDQDICDQTLAQDLKPVFPALEQTKMEVADNDEIKQPTSLSTEGDVFASSSLSIATSVNQEQVIASFIDSLTGVRGSDDFFSSRAIFEENNNPSRFECRFVEETHFAPTADLSVLTNVDSGFDQLAPFTAQDLMTGSFDNETLPALASMQSYDPIVEARSENTQTERFSSEPDVCEASETIAWRQVVNDIETHEVFDEQAVPPSIDSHDSNGVVKEATVGESPVDFTELDSSETQSSNIDEAVRHIRVKISGAESEHGGVERRCLAAGQDPVEFMSTEAATASRLDSFESVKNLVDARAGESWYERCDETLESMWGERKARDEDSAPVTMDDSQCGLVSASNEVKPALGALHDFRVRDGAATPCGEDESPAFKVLVGAETVPDKVVSAPVVRCASRGGPGEEVASDEIESAPFTLCISQGGLTAPDEVESNLVTLCEGRLGTEIPRDEVESVPVATFVSRDALGADTGLASEEAQSSSATLDVSRAELSQKAATEIPILRRSSSEEGVVLSSSCSDVEDEKKDDSSPEDEREDDSIESVKYVQVDSFDSSMVLPIPNQLQTSPFKASAFAELGVFTYEQSKQDCFVNSHEDHDWFSNMINENGKINAVDTLSQRRGIFDSSNDEEAFSAALPREQDVVVIDGDEDDSAHAVARHNTRCESLDLIVSPKEEIGSAKHGFDRSVEYTAQKVALICTPPEHECLDARLGKEEVQSLDRNASEPIETLLDFRMESLPVKEDANAQVHVVDSQTVGMSSERNCLGNNLTTAIKSAGAVNSVPDHADLRSNESEVMGPSTSDAHHDTELEPNNTTEAKSSIATPSDQFPSKQSPLDQASDNTPNERIRTIDVLDAIGSSNATIVTNSPIEQVPGKVELADTMDFESCEGVEESKSFFDVHELEEQPCEDIASYACPVAIVEDGDETKTFNTFSEQTIGEPNSLGANPEQQFSCIPLRSFEMASVQVWGDEMVAPSDELLKLKSGESIATSLISPSRSNLLGEDIKSSTSISGDQEQNKQSGIADVAHGGKNLLEGTSSGKDRCDTKQMTPFQSDDFASAIASDSRTVKSASVGLSEEKIVSKDSLVEPNEQCASLESQEYSNDILESFDSSGAPVTNLRSPHTQNLRLVGTFAINPPIVVESDLKDESRSRESASNDLYFIARESERLDSLVHSLLQVSGSDESSKLFPDSTSKGTSESMVEQPQLSSHSSGIEQYYENDAINDDRDMVENSMPDADRTESPIAIDTPETNFTGVEELATISPASETDIGLHSEVFEAANVVVESMKLADQLLRDTNGETISGTSETDASWESRTPDSINHLGSAECSSSLVEENSMAATDNEGAGEAGDDVSVTERISRKVISLPTSKTISALLDKLSTPEGATEEEIELLNEFTKVAAPILGSSPPNPVEEARIRQASYRAGLPDHFVSEVLDLATERNLELRQATSSSTAGGSTPRHLKKMFDDIQDLDESDNIDAFFRRFAALKAGGHFPDANIEALGSFGKVSNNGEEVEVDALRGYVRKEFEVSEGDLAESANVEGIVDDSHGSPGEESNDHSQNENFILADQSMRRSHPDDHLMPVVGNGTSDVADEKRTRRLEGTEMAITALLNRLSSPEGATEEEIECLNEFTKVAAPILKGSKPTPVEEALIRQASQRAGLPRHFVDQVLDLVTDGNRELTQSTSSSTVGGSTPKHLKKTFEDIPEVDENENISAFLRRFATLEAGGHFPDANIEALGSFGLISNDGDEVEVDVDRGFVRKEFEPKHNQENINDAVPLDASNVSVMDEGDKMSQHGVPLQIVEQLIDHALERNSVASGSLSVEAGSRLREPNVFDDISDVDENENISAFLNRLSALKAGGHFPDLVLDNLGSLVTLPSSDEEAVEIDLQCGFVKKQLKGDFENALRVDTLSPISNEVLSNPDNASVDSVRQINKLIQIAAPFMNHQNPTAVEEAQIRQAAQKAGISLQVVDQLLGKSSEHSEDDGTNANIEENNARNEYDEIEEVDENEAIDAFLHRFTALKHGGHFPDATLDGLGPLGRFSPENEEAVEVDVALGFVRKELAPCLSDEEPWWQDAANQEENASPTSAGRYESLASVLSRQLNEVTSPKESIHLSTGGRYDTTEDWDFGGVKKSVERETKTQTKPTGSECLDGFEKPNDNSVFFRELESRNSKIDEWIAKASMASWGNPFMKNWLSKSSRLGRPKPINGVAAAGALTKPFQSTLRRRVSGGPRHWKRSYKQRTQNHPGYFNADVFSLYETSLVAHPPHPLDFVPWENRDVRQRFLHEQSISFRRNWFGKLVRVRGNDRYRAPVCRPKSMEMPHENYPHPGEWTEEWYTTWKRPRNRDEESSEASSHASESEFDESQESNSDDDDDSTERSGNKSEGSHDDKYTKCSESNNSDDSSSEWEDIPECGHIRTIKLRIGEHISRVTPNYTSSLRRSRWRLKYFPRGTFPY